MDICAAAAMILSTKNDFKNLRSNETFKEFQKDAITLAEKCGTPKSFVNKRIKRSKKFFDEVQSDYVHESSEENFKISVFYTTLDVFIQTLDHRFEDFMKLSQKFRCLTNMDDNEENIKSLMDLQIFYKNDIDTCIIDEYKHFCDLIKEIQKDQTISYQEYLSFLISSNLETSYPSLCKLLRIFLTIATNSAGAERSFSRLGRINNYQRCTSSQTRTNNLALLSIEAEIAQEIDIDEVIDSLKSVKTRRLAL